MNYTRLLEIKNEAEKRLSQWLENSSFEDMTANGSRIRFDMSLGLLGGYPLGKKRWMNEDFDGFITLEEFNDEDYDFIIDELFERTLEQHPINHDYED